ncbi:outer membrane beta-barrel protein [uncultured Pontibacter sp.]|uniref:outer membrane beta-barrel protein n=1 Tax=uncultured Pontibacter sp. TaxID=453356 RepID=UPI0026121CA9|nr:outer membrane beta-barrel protein [uncultured Pontibacter sp.]
MKTIFLSLLLSVATLAAIAQVQPDSAMMSAKRFYAGLELSSISYNMWDNIKKVGGGFTPIAHVHLGYRLTKIMNIQAGLTYGREKEDVLSGIYYGQNDTIINYYRSKNIYGVAMPLTVQFTPFNPNRKLQLYATASFIPVIGSVWHQYSEEYEGNRVITFEVEDSGISAIATAGLQLNYRISSRLEGYGKANLLYRNVGQESAYARTAKSVAVGLNYSFNL